MIWWLKFALRRCVPTTEGTHIIEKCHATPYGGHYGAFHTHAKMAEWILLAHHVWRYKRIHSEICKMQKAWRYDRSWCDAPNIQSSNGTVWCMGQRLHVTFFKVPWLRVHPSPYRLPCRAADAKRACKKFHEVTFPRFGTPRMVISDGRSHFIDKTFRDFFLKLGAQHSIATPYHP